MTTRLTNAPRGSYSAGYLNRFDEALAASPALTTAKGDPVFDALMAERRFEDRAVKPLGRTLQRPEPIGVPGTGSSISGNPGTAGGPRRVHLARDYIR